MLRPLARSVRPLLAVALVAATASPALAFGDYARYQTFTSRSEYDAARAGAGYVQRQVALPGASLTPVSSLDGGAVTLSGTRALSLGASLDVASLDRSAPATLTFTLTPGATGFAADFSALAYRVLPTRAQVTITPTLGTPSIFGPQTETFSLDPVVFNPLDGSRFFGILLLDPVPFFGKYGDVVSVAFAARPGSTLGASGLSFRDIEYATAAPTSTVPEPATVTLLGAGLVATGLVARRRRRQG